MRKILLFPIFCTIFIFNLNLSSAFLGDDFSLNMYENIDEGINDLENTIYKKQLKTDRTGNIVDIKDKISQLSNFEGIGDCLINKELTSTDVENIGNGEIDKLFTVIGGEEDNDNCKVNNELSLELFIKKYYQKVKEIDEESRRIAEEQSKAISEIARIGIYSDGNEQNSPFDLIVDLQKINNIIFSTEIPFNGVNSENNNKIFECLANKFEGVSDDIIGSIEGSISQRDEAYLECESSSSAQNFGQNFELEGLAKEIEGQQDLSEKKPFYGISSDGNNFVCEDSSINSGLSAEQVSALIENTGAGKDIIPLSSFIGEEIGGDDESASGNIQYPETNYSRVKDSDGWPCNDFFCITVDFKTKNYDLFTGGKTKSIESLLDISNKHLKTAANKVLVQSKVTTNNFQMGWRNLNLPDMFHAGVHVQLLPPPILNLDKVGGDKEKESQDFGDDFRLKNLLSAYFENENMSFERQNDLQRFIATNEERKTITSSQDLSLNAVIEEAKQARESTVNFRTAYSRKLLDKKANNEDISDLALQFAEIERFAAGIRDYSITAAGIIKKMSEIPLYTNG